MIKYTLGFVFNEDLSQVLLIHKLTPLWQKGLINGLGGKHEHGESSYQCVSREVAEESNVHIEKSVWKKVGTLTSSECKITVLTSIYLDNPRDVVGLEKEKVEWFAVSNLPPNCIPNLYWLIPLCIDFLKSCEIKQFVAKY